MTIDYIFSIRITNMLEEGIILLQDTPADSRMISLLGDLAAQWQQLKIEKDKRDVAIAVRPEKRLSNFRAMEALKIYRMKKILEEMRNLHEELSPPRGI